jgi:beta-lactamase regulating signal transducer with metallopeptidase domain
MTAWLLTWLWQGVALTLSVGLLLKTLRLNASTRHLTWWAALAANAWLGYTTSPYRELQPIPVPVTVLAPGSYPSGMGFAAEPLLLVAEPSSLFVSAFLGIWVALAAIKLVRLLPSLHGMYVLRDRCRPFPADAESQLPLWLEAKTRGRRTELKLCDAVPGATVLGFQRPIIAIPSSLLQAVNLEELDQIILHEHAHAQRRDDWARLLQGLLQGVLWIHPAVAFIGRAMNREREMACDDWVVARTGLPKAYARCLTRAAEVRSDICVEPALAPALFGVQHDLVRRVDRLLAVKGKTHCRVSLLAAATAACAILVMSTQLKAVPLIGQHVAVALPEVASPTFALASQTASVGKPSFARASETASVGKRTFALTSPIASASARSATADKPNTFAFARLISGELRRPSTFRHAQGRPEQRRRATGSGRPERVEARDKPNASAFAQFEPDELRRDRLNAPIAPDAPDTPIAPIQARSFEGAYERSDEAAASSEQPTPWRAAANTGVEIGSAARKTGIGIAGFFSRAGVSLSRRF